MKKTILILFLAIETCYSQTEIDCSKYITTKTDKVTGQVSTSSNSSLIIFKEGETSGLGILFVKSQTGSLIMHIVAIGASNCINENSLINILFDDSARLELRTNAKMNCDKEAIVYFGKLYRNESQLSELLTKKISIMRVWTMDGYVEKEFTQQNKDQFYNTINCINK